MPDTTERVAPVTTPVPTYRSISVLAVVSVILGVLSVTALAHPGAWIVPLSGVVVSLLALRRIARYPDDLSGRSAAVVGLCLSVLFGAWASSSYASRHWLLAREGRRFSEAWLRRVLNGQLHDAHQAMLTYGRRQPQGTRLAEYYQNASLDQQDLDQKLGAPVARELRQKGSAARIEFVETVELEAGYRESTVVQNFRIVPRTNSRTQPLAVQVAIRRARAPQGIYWQVLTLNRPGGKDEG